MWTPPALPYWRLAGFYFFYFAALGGWLPYWGLLLADEGFDAAAIGLLSAILMATKVVAPNLWGALAARTGRPLALIRLGSLCALLCFMGVFVRRDFLWLVAVIAAYSFFWNGVLPQFEVVTLAHLRQHFRFYSLIRLWGSIGFILAVWLLGLWFDHHALQTLPAIIALLLLGMWLISLSLTEVPVGRSAAPAAEFWQILRRPGVVSFFVASGLLQFSHGPYYAFYSIYLADEGFGPLLIGSLWSLGVVAEVVLFTVMHRILNRWNLRQLLLASLLLSALRWWLIARYGGAVSVLAFAQLLHAASFGSSHAVAIEFVRRYFAGGHQGQGQALYSGFSFGAGGALGALASGLMWAEHASATFEMAAAACVLAAALAWWRLRGVPVELTVRQYGR